ncbi:SCO family protein [Halovenus marina]|uniref:SCO family protein n=1 Tax=Halovenus marina TaxID=3396621 RepID=UPI003F5488B4
MNRRSVLRGTVAACSVALAGCLGIGSGSAGSENTVLGPPDRDVEVDPEDLAYPGYGQELPGVTLPSALHDTEISTREFVGDRETLLTFIFTRCQGPCPAMTASLARTQVAANEDGYADEVAFMPTTFDPEFDDPERLQEFGEANGADPTADNWYFLRPASPERAQEVVHGTFGVAFEKNEIEEDGHSHSGEYEYGDPLDPGEEPVTFTHSNLLLLVNRDGFVERAYSPRPPRPDIVIDDLEAVREGYQ